LKVLNETLRQEKNQSYARKLKHAYENMLIFEQDRLKDKEQRQEQKQEATTVKLRGMALNF